MQTGRRLTLAVASATLALAGALLAPASATATVPQAGAETTQDVGPSGEIPQPQTAGPVELDTKQSCDTLQEQLDGYAEQGIETVTCLDQLPPRLQAARRPPVEGRRRAEAGWSAAQRCPEVQRRHGPVVLHPLRRLRIAPAHV